MLPTSVSHGIPAATDCTAVNCLAHSEGHRKHLQLFLGQKKLKRLENADLRKLWARPYSSDSTQINAVWEC